MLSIQRQFQQLQITDHDNNNNSRRVFTTVKELRVYYTKQQYIPKEQFVQVFKLMQSRVAFLLANGWSSRQVWEEYLTGGEFIPPLSTRHAVTNERFGYVENNTWKEWNICHVEKIRQYWHELLQAFDPKSYVFQVCKSLLTTLPGKQTQCLVCYWYTCETNMWSSTCCNNCQRNIVNNKKTSSVF